MKSSVLEIAKMVENVGNKKGLDVSIKSKEKFEVMDDEKVLPPCI